MGMIGYYIAFPEEEIQQLAAGTKMLEDMDPYNRENLDIDKSWQALYYVLCDGEPPLGYVVPMDQSRYLEFGDIGAFYLTLPQLREAYQAIEVMTRDEFLAKYNYSKMLEEDVYPLYDDGDVKDGEAEQFFDYLYSYFKDIREFFAETISEGKGLVFCIS